jgi:hypothetical protein
MPQQKQDVSDFSSTELITNESFVIKNWTNQSTQGNTKGK